MSLGKKVFTLKTYGSQLYQWSPVPDKKVRLKDQKPFFCTAISGSQGDDWITTYCYNITVLNGVQGHLAYVECDYVE